MDFHIENSFRGADLLVAAHKLALVFCVSMCGGPWCSEKITPTWAVIKLLTTEHWYGTCAIVVLYV